MTAATPYRPCPTAAAQNQNPPSSRDAARVLVRRYRRPVIGGILAAIIDWRGFFVLPTLIGVLVTTVVAIGFPETLPGDARVTGGWAPTERHLRTLAHDRLFVGATLASSLTSASYFAHLAAAPFVLQEIFLLAPEEFALVFALNAAGFAVFGFLAGRVAERWTERRVFAAGLVMIVAEEPHSSPRRSPPSRRR